MEQVKIATTILIAALLGVGWVYAMHRVRHRADRGAKRSSRSRVQVRNDGSPATVESVLRAYKTQRYEEVIRDAQALLADQMGTHSDSDQWKARIELVLGHSLFEVGRYSEAIGHLRAGLDSRDGETSTGRARFEHCLGFAHQKVGQLVDARSIYVKLLEDDDLDPEIRNGVAKNLMQIDGGGTEAD